MYKLLIVDDETKIRNGIKNCFPWEQLGFSICGEAGDGVEALPMVERLRPDVVLTDVVMPEMTGIELARKIYDRNLPVKVVLLSGHQEFDYARRALACGVYRYLLKPIDYNELVHDFTALRRMLDAESKPGMPDTQEESANDKRIADVKAYVERNISSATLQSTADAVGLSISYLSRLFKTRVGINFSDYLFSTKMAHARKLLADYKSMVYEVASAVGYDSSKNFTRAFKQYYGVTPHEFREHPGICIAK